MTDAQLQAIAAGLRAEATQSVVAALAIRDDVTLFGWCNESSAADAWNPSMAARDLFEATDVTKFDSLTQGKRDAWRRIEDFAPHDFARQKMRKAVQDAWGNTDSVAVLQSCMRKATRAEVYITPNIAGNQATTNTVTGLKLSFAGQVSLTDVSTALNRF